MLQTRVQDGQISADSNLQHGAFLRNTAHYMSKKSALGLAFLVAIVGVVWVAVAQMNAGRNLELPNTLQQANEASGLEAAEEKAQVPGESNAKADGNSNSVKIESVTNNGVTNTKVEVNGEEIPVEPNSTTHVTTPNGSQSVTNTTTQNTQTNGGSGYNFNSNSSTSSSFSHSFSSQNSVGGP